LEIQQEISDSLPSSTGSNPDISRRSASTTVMVQSGSTMLLGGLFEDRANNNSSGLPILSSIPVIGGAFGSQGWFSEKTELVLLITPRILNDNEETDGLVDELRKRMRSIEAIDWSASTRSTNPSPVATPRNAKQLKSGIAAE
jgi:general secretion pathway protein D